MMNKIALFVIWIAIFTSQAMAQADFCQALTYSVDLKTKHSTSLYNLGGFCLAPDPDKPKVTKEFLHQESKIRIQVSVEYYKGLSTQNKLKIRLTLNLDDKDSGDGFLSVNEIQAETYRNRQWQEIAVTKSTTKDNKEHSFIFECGSKPSKFQKQFFKCAE